MVRMLLVCLFCLAGNLEAGAPPDRLAGGWDAIWAAVPSDSQIIAPTGNNFAVTRAHDGLVRLWDLRTGTLLRAFYGGRGVVTGDGRLVAFNQWSEVREHHIKGKLAYDEDLTIIDLTRGISRQQHGDLFGATAHHLIIGRGFSLLSVASTDPAQDVKLKDNVVRVMDDGLVELERISKANEDTVRLPEWMRAAWDAIANEPYRPELPVVKKKGKSAVQRARDAAAHVRVVSKFSPEEAGVLQSTVEPAQWLALPGSADYRFVFSDPRVASLAVEESARENPNESGNSEPSPKLADYALGFALYNTVTLTTAHAWIPIGCAGKAGPTRFTPIYSAHWVGDGRLRIGYCQYRLAGKNLEFQDDQQTPDKTDFIFSSPPPDPEIQLTAWPAGARLPRFALSGLPEEEFANEWRLRDNFGGRYLDFSNAPILAPRPNVLDPPSLLLDGRGWGDGGNGISLYYPVQPQAPPAAAKCDSISGRPGFLYSCRFTLANGCYTLQSAIDLPAGLIRQLAQCTDPETSAAGVNFAIFNFSFETQKFTGRQNLMSLPEKVMPVWSPDLRVIAAHPSSGDFQVWQLDSQGKYSVSPNFGDFIPGQFWVANNGLLLLRTESRQMYSGSNALKPGMQVWNPRVHKMIREIPDDYVVWVKVLGDLVLTISPGKTRLFDLQHGTESAIAVRKDSEFLLSPSGERLLVRGIDKLNQIYRVNDGALLLSMRAIALPALPVLVPERTKTTTPALPPDPKGHWIVWTPAGDYFGSEGVERVLLWKRGEEYQPGEKRKNKRDAKAVHAAYAAATRRATR